MARKVNPENIVTHEGELGVKKGNKFETLLNFDFDVVLNISMGKLCGSGAVYSIKSYNEEPE